MNVFRGLFPPLITPFLADGSLNEQGLRDHVEFVIANGADGLCAGSSTGEFMNLTRRGSCGMRSCRLWTW
jgi:4-hydroxy-tetrahydrodipicolinate synthase